MKAYENEEIYGDRPPFVQMVGKLPDLLLP